MTKLEQAAQQALEFLRTRRLGAEAHIAALEAALAEPTESERDWSLLETTQQCLREHMAEIHRLRDAAQQALEALRIAQDDCINGEMAEPSPIFEKAITALKAALAEPEPEPVAPPQRQPLTIDECECAYHDLPNRPDWPNMATLWELLTAFVEGVRYAEKAHGIGGDK